MQKLDRCDDSVELLGLFESSAPRLSDNIMLWMTNNNIIFYCPFLARQPANCILLISARSCLYLGLVGWFMVFNVTFYNISVISWQSILLVEETAVPSGNHWLVTSHWQTLSHNVVSSTLAWAGFELTTLVVIGTDCTGSCKSNYNMIMAMTAPLCLGK